MGRVIKVNKGYSVARGNTIQETWVKGQVNSQSGEFVLKYGPELMRKY